MVLVGEALNSVDFDRDGLYVMNADGSSLRRIVRSGFAESPHWSPDGRAIAFVDGEPGRVVVVRGDGSARRVLGAGDNLASPNPWSPDGRRLAWGGCGGLCVYDFASLRRTRIALAGGDTGGGFSWSPDGRRLVVADDDALVAVDLSGNERSVLYAGDDSIWYPAYSPNGREVAFLAGHLDRQKRRTSTTLDVVLSTRGRVRVLDLRARTTVQPLWSPDGRRLLYTDDRFLRVLNVATGTSRRVADSFRNARWAPDGTMISFGVEPTWGVFADDVWLARADGSRARQLTSEFPTGLGFTALDWHTGSMPAARTVPLPTVTLTPTSELRPDEGYVGDLAPAPTPDSVAYRSDDECDPNAETTSSRLTIWTAPTGGTTTTTTPCLELSIDEYAVSTGLAVWLGGTNPIDGSATMSGARSGTAAPPLANWTSGQESPDIGWRADLGPLYGDGATILFETDSYAGGQLWRITDEAIPHAVQIPLPPDATDLLQVDAGRILVATGKSGFAVLRLDGTALARIPDTGTARLGGGILGVASGNTLRIYDADSGALQYQLPLADTSGHPQLLTIGNGHAAYTSGIALHLLRLNDGADRIAALPGQAGNPEALLTADGLFIGYLRGYDPKPARVLFVPTADLP
jgi:Tol biopolymer transport system component